MGNLLDLPTGRYRALLRSYHDGIAASRDSKRFQIKVALNKTFAYAASIVEARLDGSAVARWVHTRCGGVDALRLS